MGLHIRGMVVTLDTEGSEPSVAYVHDAGVLTRTDDYPGCFGGEPAQMAS